MSIATYKSLIISDSTESTSSSTGTLICNGGVGIGGILTVNGNLACSGIQVNNSISIRDGQIVGKVYQNSTELTLESIQNRIAIGENNSLIFKTDNSVQKYAYINEGAIDDSVINGYIFRYQFTTLPRYAITSTFRINTVTASTIVLSAGFFYAFPIKLVAGQVVSGAGFFFIAVSGTCTCQYSLFDTSNPGNRLAESTVSTVVTGSIYFDYTQEYTVPKTGIYYTCIRVVSIGTSASLASSPSSIIINYFQTTMTTGVLNKSAQRSTNLIGNATPSTLSEVDMTILDSTGYSVLYRR